MRFDDGFRHALSGLLVAWYLPDPVRALSEEQEVGLYVGCSVGGGVLLIVIIVLLVVCCRSSKRDKALKKRKGDYLQFTEPSTLQSLYHTNKSTTNSDKPKTNGFVPSNNVANGKPSNGSAITKIERSRSDVHDQRRHVRPEWRRQQDKRDTSVINVRHSSGSDVSVPAGIWTSNPTLTQGLYPPYVSVTSLGNQRPSNTEYGSAPALHAQRPSKRNPKSKPHRGNKQYDKPLAPVHEGRTLSGTVDTTIWEKPRVAKLNHPSKRDLDKTPSQDDTKELLPGTSSSDDTGSEREQRVVARAFSNHGFQRESPVPTPTKTPGQDGPFVAKVYSDYQQPKDFIPRNQSSKDTGKVAKVFSSYTLENAGNKRSSTHSSSSAQGSTHTSGSGTHVAKVRVSNSSSLESNGEPKYAKPQDALNKITHSDWILYSKKESRPVERSHSNTEKSKTHLVSLESKKSKKAKRSSSQVIGRYGAVANGNRSAQVTSTDIRDAAHSRYSKGVYMRNFTHTTPDRRPVSLDSSSKLTKEQNNSQKKTSSTVDKKKGKKVDRSDTKTRNSHNLVLNIQAADEVRQKTGMLPPAPVHTTNNVHSQSTIVADSMQDHSPDSLGPISESSSVNNEPLLERRNVVQNIIIQEDPNAIYSEPIKKGSRPNSTVVQMSPDSPLSPKPPPVPPITKLRDETITPVPRPSSASSHASHRHKHTDGDGISTDLDFEFDVDLDTNSVCSLDGITAALAGKNVIGDAFKFLEDFDDHLSCDGDDRL